jgi:hypothetical protein
VTVVRRYDAVAPLYRMYVNLSSALDLANATVSGVWSHYCPQCIAGQFAVADLQCNSDVTLPKNIVMSGHFSWSYQRWHGTSSHSNHSPLLCISHIAVTHLVFRVLMLYSSLALAFARPEPGTCDGDVGAAQLGERFVIREWVL